MPARTAGGAGQSASIQPSITAGAGGPAAGPRALSSALAARGASSLRVPAQIRAQRRDQSLEVGRTPGFGDDGLAGDRMRELEPFGMQGLAAETAQRGDERLGRALGQLQHERTSARRDGS